MVMTHDIITPNAPMIFQCAVYCLAQAFEMTALKEKLFQHYRAQVFRNSVLIDHKSGWSVVFYYGTVVHWHVGLEEREKLHKLLLRHAEKPLEEPEEDHFSYTVGAAQDRILQDHIELTAYSAMEVLALAHGLAQSAKLSAFESHVTKTIQSTQYLPQSLARDGKINLSRQETSRIRGQLFLTKSEIIFHYDLLDTPDFFWDYPEYEPLYHLVANYLEIRQRTEVLSKRLETVHELFEMLADEQKHQHSATLEWIIIGLIGVEIVMSLIDKLL